MGKKRRNYPKLEELLDRPWCYYCPGERDFEDLKLLISHQKAKHFKCDRCGRRLNTAGGLSVHMNQVHKETLSHVDNAIEGREGLDVEIFGMEGIPEPALLQHHQQIVDDFHKYRADRQATTGNPPPGEPGSQRPPHKKPKMETPEELKQRLAEYRAQAEARKAAAAAAASQPPPAAPATTGPPQPTNGSTYAPTSFGGAPGMLPQRPAGVAYGGGMTGASTLDDLVSGAGASASAVAAGDDIDQLIRMAEAGIRPPAAGPPAGGATFVQMPTDSAVTPTAAAPAAGQSAPPVEKEKSSRKDKAMRMIYADGDWSLEEKMARMPRYAVAM
ncbi:c2h2 finger domain containing protein [Niveomyces insectorum RCEF 264]|uniref:C2h2 finger domain containing protein n=1 Tax=Niveomyces insectorum RCEF 264 TaxID=1081102 RepID=A0A162J2J2_9HYPO|nr:c2h2 finger domain containing protein [Niveomyces insectorum RCEF 264]